MAPTEGNAECFWGRNHGGAQQDRWRACRLWRARRPFGKSTKPEPANRLKNLKARASFEIILVATTAATKDLVCVLTFFDFPSFRGSSCPGP